MINEIPKTYESIGTIMSNFDHEIEPKASSSLKKNKYYGEYTGWDFFAYVWFNKKSKKFNCLIYQYHCLVNTIESETLSGIMGKTSELYGYD